MVDGKNDRFARLIAVAARIVSQTSVSWRVNYKSFDFKSVLVSIPFLAVVALLLRRSCRRKVGGYT